MPRNTTVKRSSSGELIVEPNGKVVVVQRSGDQTLSQIIKDENEATTGFIEEEMFPDERLVQINRLQTAAETAKRYGFRIMGQWKNVDGEWIVPVACGPTPTRTVRIEDALWERAKAKAKREGTNVSAIVLEAVQRYVAESSESLRSDFTSSTV